MGKKKATGSEKKKIMVARGRVLKECQEKYPDREMAWIGGILHFTDINPSQEVPGAKKFPKKGKIAKGLAGALPPSTKKRASRNSQPRNDIIYQNLRRVSDTDGQCCECGRFPNPARKMMTLDMGYMDIVECKKCGILMRPYRG